MGYGKKATFPPVVARVRVVGKEKDILVGTVMGHYVLTKASLSLHKST